ncbi:type II toxin-antitoxin system MqsR family toxin [Pseudomonas sp. B2M1-30]|uniref:type II toxin-antitoxin system MqsR family toxin n=1 Tax=Pseudomonas TaxID=286 RepID=UPI001C3DDDAE|nr:MULTISPECIES: type II toxin-antitoxin system MqsR family toxin [Pseudomonas]MBV4475856.1 type II toxin-antitoxin system MqsR family toxin [Pseudomonas botevensis]MCU0119350.1 type II toxin-antitoxin system MqsR family toxin [Pseudomonas sp. B2M1-30]MCU7262164.1 type II toxin-antitoxin system MqsR family toxin [Pseudomonas koreensis]
MEKNTPHYNLAVIKEDVRRLGREAFTRTARNTGRDLGLSLNEMQQVVFELNSRMLYKSMTTYSDHRVWQDVYHTTWNDLEIYIKVTYCTGSEPPVISFKEKNP